MQGIPTFWIATHPGNQQRTYVPPGALIQRFVNVDVLRFLFTVIRSIRWDANSFGCTFSSALNFPAVLGKANINLVPEAGVSHLIGFVKIVYIKAANIRSNFSGAMVTPMLFDVPNGVPMGARVTTIVTLILKLCLIEVVNKTNKTKKL